MLHFNKYIKCWFAKNKGKCLLKNEQKNRKLKLEKLFRLINQSKGGKRASGDGNNTLKLKQREVIL